ncbi:hypothetical protein [Lactococcus protaetiae]|uniref:Uncharacterized protein n=1 Tax=Lactococcus protaetiae TaxID=2592653 RepID=A0A514Z927_9LACT|nr:hypothetical protein [Lactococcus protaetiae]QDK71072.1 hypothetical protein FLP15_07770 [Lactococcus protaetiae]
MLDILRNLPLILALSSALSTVFYKIFQRFIKRITEKIENELAEISKRISAIEKNAATAHKDLEKEVLRLQLLEGLIVSDFQRVRLHIFMTVMPL